MAVPSTTSDVPEVSFQDESSDADDDCIDIKEEIFADSTEPELVEPCIEPGETAADNGFAWGHPHNFDQNNFDQNIVHPFQGEILSRGFSLLMRWGSPPNYHKGTAYSKNKKKYIFSLPLKVIECNRS